MSFILACKAFFKAFSDPAAGKKFVDGTPPVKESTDPSHLQLLTLLQQSGRLIDFFKEDISSYNDEQVGAAVRKIHQDCGKVLEDFVTIRSVLDQDEGASMSIQPDRKSVV